MSDIEAEALRERCKEFYQKAQRQAILRVGSPIDALVVFIQSEIAILRAERDTVIEAFEISNIENKLMRQVCEYISEGSFLVNGSGPRAYETDYMNMAYDIAVKVLKGTLHE